MSNSVPSPTATVPLSEQMAVPADFSRLSRHAGVCGGSICVRDTRVPVWVLERSRQLKIPLSDILEDYPFLDGNDIAVAWRYAETHPEEIQREIQENQD